jgi:hypothetical protein
MTSQSQAGRLSSQRSWPVPAALVALSAIPLVAGTQAFTGAIGGALPGTGELRGDLAKGAAWIINLAVAEWVIRRPARAKAQRRIRAATPAGAPS